MAGMVEWLVVLIVSLVGAVGSGIATWMLYAQHADSVQSITLGIITGLFCGVAVISALFHPRRRRRP